MRTAPVTMIVTVYNRWDLLKTTLDHLFDPQCAFTIPEQIIIVDDGSDDAVHPSWSGCQYVRTENPGWTNPCHARNVGLKLAKFAEILTTEPEIKFISDVVGELMWMRDRGYSQEILHGVTLHEHHPDDAEPMLTLFPYYMLMRKDWLLDVGGWDEQIPGPWAWDDIDLYGRLDQIGHSQARFEGIYARHLWHPSRIEPAEENERYVRSKVYPRDLVANQGVPWGIPKH